MVSFLPVISHKTHGKGETELVSQRNVSSVEVAPVCVVRLFRTRAAATEDEHDIVCPSSGLAF